MYVFVAVAAIAVAIIIIEEFRPKRPDDGREYVQLMGFRDFHLRWVLNFEEKNLYRQLAELAREFNGVVLVKVHLLSIAEPSNKMQHRKRKLQKAREEYVDFVICDQSFVAMCVIMMDHTGAVSKRTLRHDEYLDDLLRGAGYVVIRATELTEEIEETILAIKGISHEKDLDDILEMELHKYEE